MKFSQLLIALVSTAGLASAALQPYPEQGGLQTRTTPGGKKDQKGKEDGKTTEQKTKDAAQCRTQFGLLSKHQNPARAFERIIGRALQEVEVRDVEDDDDNDQGDNEHAADDLNSMAAALERRAGKTIRIEMGKLKIGSASDDMVNTNLDACTSLFMIGNNGVRLGAHVSPDSTIEQAKAAAKRAKALGATDKLLIDTPRIVSAGQAIANAVFEVWGKKSELEIDLYSTGAGVCYDFRLKARETSTVRQV